MSAAVHHEDEPSLLMGLPMSNGKLALWLFLVTEIMFFTGLIGAYIVSRQSAPSRLVNAGGTQLEIRWPSPHDVHLAEWMGAVNTFVLICSSVSIVLAHHALGKKKVKEATQWVAVTLALGCVFMVIKGFEYKAKIDHGILPGKIGDHLEHTDVGFLYKDKIRASLKGIVEKPEEHHVAKESEIYKDVEAFYKALDATEAKGDQKYVPPLSPPQVGLKVNELLAKHKDKLHLAPYVPYGNSWASYYFAMTGFHALHVLGGLVIFVIILLMAAAGKFGPQHESLLELTGLYWHFVDVVWIFLFPLLYLV